MKNTVSLAFPHMHARSNHLSLALCSINTLENHIRPVSLPPFKVLPTSNTSHSLPLSHSSTISMAMAPQAPPALFGPSSGAPEVYRGGANCLQRLVEILEENGLPTGHLPFDGGIIELGYNRENGFVWVKQRERKQHYFPKAKLAIAYEAEVTGYLKWRGMKKIKGVVARKLFLNVNAVEFSVDGDPVGGNICVKTSLGLSQVLPASSLQLLED